MTDGLDEGPTEEDRRLAADHDDEGVPLSELHSVVEMEFGPPPSGGWALFACRDDSTVVVESAEP